MSQFTYQPAPVNVKQDNGLAVAGFVCSVLGLFTGVLSPIGLILSLVALGRPGGRGFAVAGIILGLIGSCGIILVLLLIPAAVLAVLGITVAAIALAEPEKMELTTDMANIAIAVAVYQEENDVLPADLSVLNLRSVLKNDPWGNPYEYHFIDDDPGFDLVSWGEDGQAGTEDDIYLTKLGETWDAAGKIVTSSDDDSGTVTLTLGDKVFTLHGDERGGRITLDTGEKVIELTGNEAGGDITVTTPNKDKPQDTGKTEGEDGTTSVEASGDGAASAAASSSSGPPD